MDLLADLIVSLIMQIEGEGVKDNDMLIKLVTELPHMSQWAGVE